MAEAVASSVHQSESMYDIDALEAINFEQLVTPTDRLLLRRGRLPKHRAIPASAAERTMVVRSRRTRVGTTAILFASTLSFVLAVFVTTLA